MKTLTDQPLEPIAVPMPRAVEISGLSRTTLYRQAIAGRLRMLKFGRSTLVDYASLRALLASLPVAELKNAA